MRIDKYWALHAADLDSRERKEASHRNITMRRDDQKLPELQSGFTWARTTDLFIGAPSSATIPRSFFFYAKQRTVYLNIRTSRGPWVVVCKPQVPIQRLTDLSWGLTRAQRDSAKRRPWNLLTAPAPLQLETLLQASPWRNSLQTLLQHP